MNLRCLGRTKLKIALIVLTLFLGSSRPGIGQQDSLAKQIPAVDAGAGPCSVEFTVLDDHGKPVYGATINVRFAYGFMGVRKQDLQVGTNIDGKGRFTGLPAKIKEGTMFFRASKGNLEGTLFYDPSKNCTAQQGISLLPKHESDQ